MTDLEKLAARLDGVERQLRVYKRLALCMAAAVGGLIVFAAAPGGGSQRLAVRDSAGKERVVITSDGINFYSGNGAKKLFIGQAADGTPLLSLRDANGVVRLDLLVAGGGVPAGSLYDGRGKPRAVVQVSDQPFIGIKDGADKFRASMSLTKGGAPSLDLSSASGDVVASLFQDAGGDFGDIQLSGKGGGKRVVGVGSDTPYLALFSPTGSEKWSAP